MDKHRIKRLCVLDPGHEGFLVQSFLDDRPSTLLAAAVDDRGSLYAVGEILRRAVVHKRSIELPRRSRDSYGSCIRDTGDAVWAESYCEKQGEGSRLDRGRDATCDTRLRAGGIEYVLYGTGTDV